MPIEVRLRRVAYRCAFALLRVYWLLARPAVAGVKAVITDGHRVLLVRHTYGVSSWDLPGGALKRGEAPAHAIEREMHEELGIAIDSWTSLGKVNGVMHHRRDTLHCFHTELAARPLTLDYGELATAQWFPSDQLPVPISRYVPQILALRR